MIVWQKIVLFSTTWIFRIFFFRWNREHQSDERMELEFSKGDYGEAYLDHIYFNAGAKQKHSLLDYSTLKRIVYTLSIIAHIKIRKISQELMWKWKKILFHGCHQDVWRSMLSVFKARFPFQAPQLRNLTVSSRYMVYELLKKTLISHVFLPGFHFIPLYNLLPCCYERLRSFGSRVFKLPPVWPNFFRSGFIATSCEPGSLLLVNTFQDGIRNKYLYAYMDDIW